MLFADFDPTVHHIVAQPFMLRADVNGQPRRHILDYLWDTDDGPVVVDVVRAERLTHPRIQQLCAWTREVIESMGWRPDMKRAGVVLGVGTRFAYDGEIMKIVEVHAVDGAAEAIAKDLRAQTVRRFALSELMFSNRSRLLTADLSEETVTNDGDIAAVIWSAAPRISAP